MKTNQLMTIAFKSGDVQVFHKTAMGDLTQLWSAGNSLRLSENKSVSNLSMFLKSSRTTNFIAELSKQGLTAIEITGRGNTKKTWACIELLIFAAENQSVAFHVEVIQTFISGKILSFRDESGDRFKAMNISINSNLKGREGKDNKGVMIQVAKMIKHKVNPELITWNDANAHDLKYRLEIEDRITAMLDLELIESYEHLKLIITKL